MQGNLINQLRGGLVVSCQPVPGGPFDDPDSVVKFALAARDAGAVALRIEGAANVSAVTSACDLPVIGLIKRDLLSYPIRITPFHDDILALAEAGAAIIAFDATDRPRPASVAFLLNATRETGCLAMADIADLHEAKRAVRLGFDLIGTTLSGYTSDSPAPSQPDLTLLREAAALGRPIIAEGRYNTPALAATALREGAHAVVVGSAITRTEHVTAWFLDAMRPARDQAPVLALDIGGSKIAVALIANGQILERRLLATDPQAGPEAWLKVAADAVTRWRGGYGSVSAAVSGIVHNGAWSAANPATLPVPNDYNLTERLSDLFGVPATALNDAQAAAWGEFRHGTSAGQDMLFLTISSGIGGGIISGGRLLQGAHALAGHIGQFPIPGAHGRPTRLEDRASGFAIARAAEARGHPPDTRAVFEALQAGEDWAETVIAEAIEPLAALLPGLQASLDPEVIVIGGGVGLAEGYLDRLKAALADVPPPFRPRLLPAQLGANAGLLGAADHPSPNPVEGSQNH